MIGIFDSGIGGLSILNALVNKLPEYSTMYLADSAKVPYGRRNAGEIYELTRDAVDVLFSRGCEVVILACNSASACALRRLQQEWLPDAYPDKRVLGILVPTIEQVTSGTYSSLGILATPATIACGAYEREIKKRAPKMKLIQQPCPGLVDLIENGKGKEEIRQKAAMFTRTMLRKNDHMPDAVLLGCTHYSLVRDVFEELMPEGVSLFDQPVAVANSFAEYLERHPEIATALGGVPPAGGKNRKFFTTGDPAFASERAKQYYSNLNISFVSI